MFFFHLILLILLIKTEINELTSDTVFNINSCQITGKDYTDVEMRINKIRCKTINEFVLNTLEKNPQTIGSFDSIFINKLSLIRENNANYFAESEKYLSDLDHSRFNLDDEAKIIDNLIINDVEIVYNGSVVLSKNSFQSFRDNFMKLNIFNCDSTSLNVSELIDELNSVRNSIQVNIENSEMDFESLIKGLTNEQITTLSLVNDSLKLEKENLFESLGNLKELILNKNKITQIKKDTFKGLSSLELLDLSQNNILSISDLSLQPIQSLLHLNVADNLIKVISERTFKGFVSLKSLNLKNNNISKIHKSAFKTQTNLETIIASFNLIAKIEDNLFSNNKKIKELDFSNNQINSIGIESINGLSTLKIFNLDDNLNNKFSFLSAQDCKDIQ
jgi:Leucine-rich repeat (LRR) protein